MPTLEFCKQTFDDLSRPLQGNGSRNSYHCFEDLKKRYGVYVFYGKDDCIVRYVGSAGTRNNRDRDVYTRLTQHYTKSKTSATFYKNWHASNCASAPRDSDQLFHMHDAFLARFGQWSLDTLTTRDHDAVELVQAVEHSLIHLLRPKYVGHSNNPGSMPAQLSDTISWRAIG